MVVKRTATTKRKPSTGSPGGGCGMTAHLLLTQAFRFAAPALLAPFSYCQIVFAGLLGLVIFSQVHETSSLVGIAIICLSGLGAAWMQRGK